MPLDTQPLSRGRRMLMLAVLLALLGGSLAFAQYLVVRSRKPFISTSLDSFGFSTAEAQTYPGELDARSGLVDGHPRRVDLFSWEQPAPLNPDEQGDAAAQLFLEIAKVVPQDSARVHLGGHDAVQVAGADHLGRFALLRLAQVEDHLVAICYSGPGPYTDADKATFNTLCNVGVRFNP